MNSIVHEVAFGIDIFLPWNTALWHATKFGVIVCKFGNLRYYHDSHRVTGPKLDSDHDATKSEFQPYRDLTVESASISFQV